MFSSAFPSRSVPSILPLRGRVAFFGRTLDDYETIFALDSGRLGGRRILDVAAGPASFTLEATLRGADVVALDPLYQYGAAALRERFRRDEREVRAWVRAHPASYTMRAGEEEALWKRRRRATEHFLGDYAAGVAAGRYRAGALPRLPFAERSFDQVLCGHFLFLYAHRSDLGLEFHDAACRELCRVARETVHLYPLTGFDGVRVPFLDQLRRQLEADGVESRIEALEAPVLRGADARLVLYPHRPTTISRS